MKKLISVSIILSLLLAFSSCGGIEQAIKAHETLPSETLEQQKSYEDESFQEENLTSFTDTDAYGIIKDKADSIASSYSATAVQAAVIKGGKLYYTYEYGEADISVGKEVTPDTKFRVASLSKLVTDIIFMALCDEGLVSLEGDIGDYLGFSVRNPSFPDTVITPAMLMSHTSSIIDTSAFLNSRLSGSSTPVSSLLSSGAFSYSEPGTAYSYSNFSVALIGSIAELVTKTPFEELAKKYVFTPLGIDAGFTANAVENKELIANLYGNGGYSVEQQLSLAWCDTLGQTHHLVQGNLTISAKDYMNIAAVLSNGGVSANGTRLISEESASELLKVRYESDFFKSCFGLLKQTNVIEGTEVCTHTGSNFGMFSAFVIDPATGNGVAVLTSGAPGTKDTSTDIYSICLEIIKELYPA